MKRLHDSVKPITLSQGSADWHLLRKLSLTSSQSHESIKALLPDYGGNEDVVTVMKYLEGPDWALEEEEEQALTVECCDSSYSDKISADQSLLYNSDLKIVC